MKKFLSILLFSILLFTSFTPAFAVESASLPNFPVTFNGILIDNQHATYPLLVYKNITYFPMTWDYSSALGLSTTFTESKGLVIEKSGKSAELVQSLTANNSAAVSYRISKPYFPITVNGKRINNATESYPIFIFRNITYFPLTWRFAVDEFGWAYSYTDATGLKIATTSESEMTSPSHKMDTINYGNGDKYVGEVLNAQKDGKGTYTWANGDYYTGEWMQNKKHGTGTLMRANGNSYSGDWRNDDKNGTGTFVFSYGDRYTGEVTQSKYHGIGTYTWADGDAYTGTWLHGKRTGNGIFTFADGSVYEGGFLNDLFDGYGKMTKSDGNVEEGIWTDGVLTTKMPAPPTNLAVSTNSDNTIRLTWTPAGGSNYATLYYTTDPAGKWAELRQPDSLPLKLRGTGYTFREASAGQVYYFKMTSTYSGNESVDSSIVSIKAGDTSTTITSHVIQSRIQGTFDGFATDRTYVLENGQVWKQTSFEKETAHRFMPNVLIYLDGDEYKILIEGSDSEPTVVKIK